MDNNGVNLLQPEDPFDKLSPQDGFHVVKIETQGEVSLHVQAYGGGELLNLTDPLRPENATQEIATWPNASNEDQGDATRLHLVLDAIARYLTTGGTWHQLEYALKSMRRVAMGGIVFEGYHLCDSYLTTELSNFRPMKLTMPDGQVRTRMVGVGGYQHVFVKNDNSGAAVVWEEPSYTSSGGVYGGFIDRTTLADILEREQCEEEEPEEDAGSPEVASEEGLGGLGQLQYREHPQAEGEAGADPSP